MEELEYLTCFSLLSSIEGTFRMDYASRFHLKKKDTLSIALRNIYNRKGKRAALENDILKCWLNNHSEGKEIIVNLLEVYNYRHWIAHGRYWIPKFGRPKYDYLYLYDLCLVTLTKLPFI